MHLLKVLFLAGSLVLALDTAKASVNESYPYCVIVQTNLLFNFPERSYAFRLLCKIDISL